MKKLLLSIFVLSCVFRGHAEPQPAGGILAFVRRKLPNAPVELTGTLKVCTKRGSTQNIYPVKIKFDWNAATPTAHYRVSKETLNVSWKTHQPSYQFSNPNNQLSSNIFKTGLSWADLSFSFLWWPDSKLIAEEKKMDRDCYVVEVPVLDSQNTMRLWIEKEMGILLELQTLDPGKKVVRRMTIKSIERMDGMWMPKDLEIRNRDTGTTTLEITHLKWGKPHAPTAFDSAKSINAFSLDLYQKLAAERDGNLFLSPYSISSALSMVYAGARGETEKQMKYTLYLGTQEETHSAFSRLREKLNEIQQNNEHIRLNVANSLWPQKDYTFHLDYLALIQKFYGSEIKFVDYKTNFEDARNKINAWVEKKTNNKIQNLITPGVLTDITRLVLVNAIYFKGTWETEFEVWKTKDRPFHISDTQTVTVPTMGASWGLYAENESFKTLELPYKGKELSMLILLPQNTNGLSELEQMITPETLAALNTETNDYMIVRIPRFTIGSSLDLHALLPEMGMVRAFSEKANFSGITDEELWLDSAAHMAIVTVGEKGTEAVAATAIGASMGSVTGILPTKFIADHPFLFLIRENSTGTILFIGRMIDPSK